MMADTLIACKTCGKDKASGAHKCPHCGAHDEAAQTASMKDAGKLLLIVVGGVFGFLLLLVLISK
jgi:predicted ATP-dependent serine protease